MCYWCESKLVWLLWRALWLCLLKLKICIPFDPDSPLLGIHPREMLAGVHQEVFQACPLQLQNTLYFYQ